VRRIGRDDVIREAAGERLEEDQAAVDHPVHPLAGARFVELWGEIVMVVEEPLSEELERGRHDEQRVGRVVHVDDVDAPAQQHPHGPDERHRGDVRRLEHVAEERRALGRVGEAQDAHAAEHLPLGLTGPARADHGHLDAGRRKGGGFAVDTWILRVGVVAQQHQRARPAGRSVGRMDGLGHVAETDQIPVRPRWRASGPVTPLQRTKIVPAAGRAGLASSARSG
jgi:hypothetical protein